MHGLQNIQTFFKYFVLCMCVETGTTKIRNSHVVNLGGFVLEIIHKKGNRWILQNTFSRRLPRPKIFRHGFVPRSSFLVSRGPGICTAENEFDIAEIVRKISRKSEFASSSNLAPVKPYYHKYLKRPARP